MWRKRAKYQLRPQPLCEVCLKDGRINAATIADHIEPHKGDQEKFVFGELQSLCKLHHESAKKREEASGYSTQIGTDGCPRGLAVSLCHRRAFRRQELHP